MPPQLSAQVWVWVECSSQVPPRARAWLGTCGQWLCWPASLSPRARVPRHRAHDERGSMRELSVYGTEAVSV